jgi:hypothetical protein
LYSGLYSGAPAKTATAGREIFPLLHGSGNLGRTPRPPRVRDLAHRPACLAYFVFRVEREIARVAAAADRGRLII